jgi:hypothetical protein
MDQLTQMGSGNTEALGTLALRHLQLLQVAKQECAGVRGRAVGGQADHKKDSSLVVIDDFNVFRAALGPSKANPVLHVNADRMLSGPISGQGVQTSAGRQSQIVQSRRQVQRVQNLTGLPPDALIDLPRCFGVVAIEEVFRCLVSEGSNHRQQCYRYTIKLSNADNAVNLSIFIIDTKEVETYVGRTTQLS